MAIHSQTFVIITNRLIMKCWKKLNVPTKFEKNRTKPGNPYYLVLFENRTKPGTVLSETVLSGDSLYKLCKIKNLIDPNFVWSLKQLHGMFLEWWNTTKSLSAIWEHLSCLLDEGIAKICKKLKSHGGFLSYLQDRTANPANLAAIFCPALVCPQKAIVGIKFLAYFCSPLVK